VADSVAAKPEAESDAATGRVSEMAVELGVGLMDPVQEPKLTPARAESSPTVLMK
jgi:hypothetical protein